MELVGKSLNDMKSILPGKVFSSETGLNISSQCLEGIEDLHNPFGYIHRDLKPGNFACGLNDKKRVIYIFDYGISRRILNEKGDLKTPRIETRFKGTIRFASLTVHKCQEQGYKDDIEVGRDSTALFLQSWLYLMFDLMVKEGLPWRKLQNKDDVLKCKMDCRVMPKRDLLWGTLKCKDELVKILDYIDTLKYYDHVDYQYIYKLLISSAQSCETSFDDPRDWDILKE